MFSQLGIITSYVWAVLADGEDCYQLGNKYCEQMASVQCVFTVFFALKMADLFSLSGPQFVSSFQASEMILQEGPVPHKLSASSAVGIESPEVFGQRVEKFCEEENRRLLEQ